MNGMTFSPVATYNVVDTLLEISERFTSMATVALYVLRSEPDDGTIDAIHAG